MEILSLFYELLKLVSSFLLHIIAEAWNIPTVFHEG